MCAKGAQEWGETLMDPTFIVLVSFVLFLGFAYRLGYRQSLAALDHKIETIRQSLDEATQAKEAAIQALHEERHHQEEALQEIELISKRTEDQALILRQQALQDINQIISTRQKTAEEMIQRMHSMAIQTIKEEATIQTIETFKAIVTKDFSPAQQKALNDAALAQISAQLTKRQRTASNTQKPKRLKAKRSVRK
jgi:F0F1-type ATP synthase membrane subunit b/b'